MGNTYKSNLLRLLNKNEDDDFESDESMKGINYDDIKSDRSFGEDESVESSNGERRK